MSTKYKIRNRVLEVVGEYTGKEILKRIRAGKYTGEEEVSSSTGDRWQKLASHPVFYDAFLERMFPSEYQLPPGDKIEVSSSQAPRKEKTRGHEEDGDDDPDAHHGRTIQKAEIDELFSVSKEISPGTQMSRVGKTDLIVVDPTDAQKAGDLILPGPQPDGPLPRIAQAVSPEKPSPESDDAALLKKRKRRRQILVGTVALLLLYVLLRPSDPNPSSITEPVRASATPVLGSSATPEERAITLGDEASMLLIQDTELFYRGATEVLREALDADPASVPLLGHLAIALARLSTTKEQAEEHRSEIDQLVARAQKTDPHASELYRAQAILAQAEGKLEEAKTFAVKAAESDPVAAENLLLIGELHYTAGNLSEARTILAEAVRAEPARVRSNYYLALTLSELEDNAAAQAGAMETLKLNPLHPRAYMLLADLAARRNQLQDAQGLYETCGRLARFATPDVAGKAYYRLAELQELANLKIESQTSYQLAYYYLKGGDSALRAKVKELDTSDKTLRSLATQYEYQMGYFQDQGTGLLSQGKTEEAVRFFQAAQLLAPKDGMALIQLGEVMEKTATSYEDFRRVMSYYQRAIDRDPKEAMGYIKLGLLETEQYNFDRGYKLLMQAVALSPDSEKPYVALGKHYYKRQDYNEAVQQFLKASKINPSDSEIFYYAGKLRLVGKKEGAREAAQFFSQAYSLDPRNYDALAEWLKLKVVNYEKNFAVKFVNNLLAAEPNNPMLYWVLGEIYSENKEHRRAISFYHKSLDFDNRQGKVRMSLAKALESVGELDKAVAEFRLASLLDRRNSEGFYRAADLLFQMKSYQQAEEVLRFLMSVTPNYPGVHRYLSKIAQLRDQKDGAIEAMQQEVANNPQNYKFVLEFAELLIEYDKLDDAIGELKKVTNLPNVNLAPEFKAEKIRAFLLLSRCYRGKKQFENAEGAVLLALSLDTNDPELHRELGYVYYGMQRDKEGVKAFETYLERAPAARDAPAIKGLIKKMMIEE